MSVLSPWEPVCVSDDCVGGSSSPVLAYKSSDQTLAHDGGLEDVTQMGFAVAADALLRVTVVVITNSTDPGFPKLAWSVPVGADFLWWVGANEPGAGISSASGGYNYIFDGEGVTQFHGRYVGGGTAGTFQLQAGQVAADVSDTKILAGSHILGWQLA